LDQPERNAECSGIVCGTRRVSSMVVMADEVFDVMVGHDAVYRRGPEQNARQQSDKSPTRRHRTRGWTHRVRTATFRPVFTAGLGERDGRFGEHRTVAVDEYLSEARYRAVSALHPNGCRAVTVIESAISGALEPASGLASLRAFWALLGARALQQIAEWGACAGGRRAS
jgi:hypothetical protein